MTEPEIDTQNGHNDCRGSGKYGRWAACGCGISLVPLRLGAVVGPRNCWEIDAESLAVWDVEAGSRNAKTELNSSSRFNATPACDRRTDGQTDRRTRDDSKYLAIAYRRAEKNVHSSTACTGAALWRNKMKNVMTHNVRPTVYIPYLPVWSCNNRNFNLARKNEAFSAYHK